MHDHGLPDVARKSELLGECPSLLLTRRVVVVIVETAFADRNRALVDQLSNIAQVRTRIEANRIVWMYAGGTPDETTILSCDERRSASGAEDILGAAS